MSISAGFRCAVAVIVAAASLSVVAATASAASLSVVAATASAATASATLPIGTSPADVHAACSAPTKGHLQCLALARTDVKAGTGVRPDAAPPGYGPADLHAAYALPADGGAAATVAIVDAYDDPAVDRRTFAM